MPEAASLVVEFSLSVTLSTSARDLRRSLDEVRETTDLRFVQFNATQPGLRARDLDGSARRDLLATLRRRELNLSGLDLWIPPAHLVDPTRVSRAIDTIQATISLAADLGRCPVCLVLTSDESAAEVVTAIEAHAERSGVPLADFQRPRPVGTSRAGVGIDPAAILGRSEDPATVMAAASGRLAAVRLCDLLANGMRGPLGEPDGQLDAMAFKVALSIAGFTQPLVIDTRQWNDPACGLRQTIDFWRAGA